MDLERVAREQRGRARGMVERSARMIAVDRQAQETQRLSHLASAAMAGIKTAEQYLREYRQEVDRFRVEANERWLNAVAEVRARYPEDVFPADSPSLDAQSGTFARKVCDEIIRLAEGSDDG